MRENLKRPLFFLILISTIVRLITATLLELGNDEVYYITYAKYPDWSHFDHPAMVGLIIQIFSLNLLLESELFIRLGGIILCSINTYLIFLAGKAIRNENTGFIASLLFTASIYCFIISGTFILPDSPQLFFWLISILLFINYIKKQEGKYIIFSGISIGLAMLSKYHGVYLWVGFVLYLLIDRIRNRENKIPFYAILTGVLISLILFLPVILWNINNGFISFDFHSNRVDLFSTPGHLRYLMVEIAGEIFYNNPVNFVIILISLVWVFRNYSKDNNENKYILLLLCLSLPLIATVILISIFSSTLPHWSGPGYVSLIIIGALWLDSKNYKNLIPLPAGISLGFIFVLVVTGLLFINFGIFQVIPKKENIKTLGKNDFTLDMYGWKQLSRKYREKLELHKDSIALNTGIVSNKWFPGANLDYYVASKNRAKLFVVGDIQSIHKYYWINKERGGMPEKAIFINLSNNYIEPEYFQAYYKKIIPFDTISIYRSGEVVKYGFLYYLKKGD